MLDRPVWGALTTRQQHLAVGDELALRFAPDVNILAAPADTSPEAMAALAALAPPGGKLVMVDAEDIPVPPGMQPFRQAVISQMVLERLAPGEVPDHLELGDADAAEMLALATLTEPGPFVTRTHAIGGFVGIRVDGQLVAMAGERMKLPGYSEVSAVCTHPDFRGRGFAGGLMRVVIGNLLARGEGVFLHSYAHNAGAIALYESLGFRVRRELFVLMVERQAG